MPNTRPSQRRPEIGIGQPNVPSNYSYKSPGSAETFQIGEGEQQNLFDELLKMISTGTAQARNVSMEQSALSNASDAARQASLRGVDYRGGMAMEAGTTDLQKFIANYNRQGTQQAFQNKMAMKQFGLQQEALEGSLWQDLMGLLGGGVNMAGAYAGYKLFSNTGN